MLSGTRPVTTRQVNLRPNLIWMKRVREGKEAVWNLLDTSLRVLWEFLTAAFKFVDVLYTVSNQFLPRYRLPDSHDAT